MTQAVVIHRSEINPDVPRYFHRHRIIVGASRLDRAAGRRPRGPLLTDYSSTTPSLPRHDSPTIIWSSVATKFSVFAVVEEKPGGVTGCPPVNLRVRGIGFARVCYRSLKDEPCAKCFSSSSSRGLLASSRAVKTLACSGAGQAGANLGRTPAMTSFDVGLR